MSETRSGHSAQTAHFVRRPAICVTGSLPSRASAASLSSLPAKLLFTRAPGNGVRPVTPLTVTPSARPTSVTTQRNPGDPTPRSPKTAPLSASFSGRSGSSQPSRDTSEHLLIVDDEASIRLSLDRFLSRCGYRVSTAGDGGEALAILDAQRSVDLVITDLAMPHSDGRELILAMREEHASVPVLVISGFPAALLPDVGPDEKPLAFLAKPFGLDVLASEVRRLLDARAWRRQEAGEGPTSS